MTMDKLLLTGAWVRTLLATAVLVCLVAVPASASTFAYGDNIHVSSLHAIEDDFYAFGSEVLIDGKITGDLIAGSFLVSVKGEIGGSASLGGRVVNFSGRATNSVRCFGQQITMNGQTTGSLLAMGSHITVGQAAVVQRDLNAYGEIVTLEGVVGGNVECGAKTIVITGQVTGDVQLEADRITLSPPASINGNVTYKAATREAFVQEPGVTVAGTVTWEPPKADEEGQSEALADWTFKIACLLAAFIFGLVVTAFFRPYAEEAFAQLNERFAVSLSAGVVGLLVLVLAVIVLVISAVLSLAGMLMLSGDLVVLGVFVLVLSILLIPVSSFTTVVGGIIFYSAVILVGFWVGFLVKRIFGRAAPVLSRGALFIGLAILTLVFAVPYLGTLILLLVSVSGAGAIILGIRHCRRETSAQRRNEESREGEPPPAPAS